MICSCVMRLVICCVSVSPLPWFTGPLAAGCCMAAGAASLHGPMGPMGPWDQFNTQGAIPEQKRFVCTLPCPLAHPGICAKRDAAVLPDVHGAVKVLRARLAKCDRASAHCLQASGADGVPLHTVYFGLAHFRASRPRVALLANAQFLYG